ncbi:MAG: hypothetical protein ACFFD2_07425 [Promethearchaeota archaeon]
MKLKKKSCKCDYPSIAKEYPKGCTLNQIIKCHGEESISELFKHIKLEE